MNRIPCSDCGAMILPSTAERNAGLCARCLKAKNAPPEAYPSYSAFVLSASLLGLNSFNVFYQFLIMGQVYSGFVGAFIDAGLAIALLKKIEQARVFTIIRSFLGAIFYPLILWSEYSQTDSYIMIGIQLLFNSAIIFLLLGNTNILRLIYGGVALAIFALAFLVELVL